jgi:hypothetical protein
MREQRIQQQKCGEGKPRFTNTDYGYLHKRAGHGLTVANSPRFAMTIMSSPSLLLLLALRLVVVIVIRKLCVSHMSCNSHVSTITTDKGRPLGLIFDFLQTCTSPEGP